ncbi:MAG: hypothetical protein ACR9NN_18000 [Nostochopsis sp.]
MTLPKQSSPVIRTTTGRIKPEEQPFKTIDFEHASKQQKLNIIFALNFGANYHVPARFLVPVNSSGCHLLSGNSMALCLASFGLL